MIILRRMRLLLAGICFTGVCLLFLGAGSILPSYLAFLAKIQLVPAILAGSFIVSVSLLVLTLVFGRVYCSVVCPLGVFQDIVGYFGKKQHFHYTSGKTRLRVAVLLTFVVAFLFGLPVLFGILEPYSAFGRMVTGLAVCRI